MRVFELRDAWDPANLTLAERPDPKPAAGEVLVRLTAAALSYRDTLVVRRGYGRYSGELPLIPVSQGAGTIVATGPGVTAWHEGDRVCPLFNQGWLAGGYHPDYMWTRLGGPLDGVMRELMVVPADRVVGVPAHLSDLEAATLPLNGLTAWNALFAAGGLTPGETLLVQGTGSVALMAIQLGNACGAKVIATSSNDAKLAQAAAAGAAQGINYREVPDWGKTVLALSQGHGADLILEMGGAGTVEQSCRALAYNGRISLVGNITGNDARFNLFFLFSKAAHLMGITHGNRAMLRELTAFVAEHQIRPMVDERVYAFDELPEALHNMSKAEHVGNICLRLAN
jgi:NADPH:quinone reductase-like Zn-dependent oxidoreductase